MSACDNNKPIELPCSKQATCSGEKFSNSSEVCENSEYENIIYVTGSNCFFLLKKDADKIINKAVADFKKKVFSVATGPEMVPKLSEAGCDIFVSISPASFLESRDRERFNELASYRKETQDELYESYRESAEEDAEDAKNRIPLSIKPLDASLLKKADKMYKQQNELELLKEKGFKFAEELGYLVDREHQDIYDPRQKKIKKHLDIYIKNSEIFADKTKTPSNVINDIKKTLSSLNEIKQKITICSPAIEDEIKSLNLQLSKLSTGHYELVKSIAALAALGIAVPEYALASVEKNKSGADLYAEWFSYLAEKQKFQNDMDKQLSALKAGTDRAPVPPNEAFRSLIENMAEQQRKADILYTKALDVCKKSTPQMLLLWDPKGYKIPKMKCIANPSYPLREFVSVNNADGSKSVRTDYFSLKNIPSKITLKYPNKFADVRRMDRDPELFEMLEPYGVKIIELRRDWFSKEGFFLPTKFYSDTIDNSDFTKRIKINKLEKNRGSWEYNITRFLFRDISELLLSPVDENASGVFARMVSSGVNITILQSQIVSVIDRQHPNPKLRSIQKKQTIYFKGTAQTDWTFLRGEFELVNHTFPEHPTSYFLPIVYEINNSYGEKIKVSKGYNLGKWSFHAVVKCFGFIGASIMLSSAIYGETPMFVPKDKTKKNGSKKTYVGGGTIEGFIGAQVGATLSGQLLWEPPIDIKEQLPPTTPVPITLGSINLIAMASLGLSQKLPFEIKYNNGNLTVNMQPMFWGGFGYNMIMSSQVNFSGICLVIELFQEMLKEADYHPVKNFDTDTFNFLSNYALVCLVIMPWALLSSTYRQSLTLQVGILAAKSKTFIEDIISLFKGSENAGLIAYSLTGHLLLEKDLLKKQKTELAIAKWARLLTPESFGHLLGSLVYPPSSDGMKIGQELYYNFNQLKAMQQLTISRLLGWILDNQQCNAEKPIADQRRYQEAISRMRERNVGNNEMQRQMYCSNIHELDAFMNNSVSLDPNNDKSWIKIYMNSIKKYYTYREQLSMHLTDWEKSKLVCVPSKIMNNMADCTWEDQ